MIQFTDKRLYLKGTCASYLLDPNTGAVRYYTNKGQTANLETSVTMGEIRAGLGNPISAIIPSDSAVNVNFAAADFSLFAKAANAGAAINYSAVVPVCDVVTAEGTSLSIDVTKGAPAAFYGSSRILCYIQTVGEKSPISTDGTAYEVNTTTGVISDFTATSGQQYKVWYYTNKASAQVAAISTLIDPMVFTYIQQMAVYANSSGSAQDAGTRVGWVYAVVPYLKLGGNASLNGDQSNPDTTSLTGQAVSYDDDVVSATCSNCGASNLAYYIYAPDDGSENVTGIAVVGGVFSVAKSTQGNQIPGRLVMANSQLVVPNPAGLIKYTATGAPSGTTVSADGKVTAGATTGDFDVTMEYPADGTAEYTNTVSVSIV